jgi:hypothetical protein
MPWQPNGQTARRRRARARSRICQTGGQIRAGVHACSAHPSRSGGRIPWRVPTVAFRSSLGEAARSDSSRRRRRSPLGAKHKSASRSRRSTFRPATTSAPVKRRSPRSSSRFDSDRLSVERLLACRRGEGRRSGRADGADACRPGRGLGAVNSHGLGRPEPCDRQPWPPPRPERTLSVGKPATCQLRRAAGARTAASLPPYYSRARELSSRGGCCHVSDVGI